MGAYRYRERLILSSVAIAIVSIPLILRMVPPNGWYGFRTSTTQSSPDVWYQANAFLGWALLVAAVISAIALVILPATAKRWLLFATFLVPILGAVVASFVYVERFG